MVSYSSAAVWLLISEKGVVRRTSGSWYFFTTDVRTVTVYSYWNCFAEIAERLYLNDELKVIAGGHDQTCVVLGVD